MRQKAGAALALAAGLMFGVMTFLVHHDDGSAAPAQFAFSRGVVGTVALLPMAANWSGRRRREPSGGGAVALWLRAIAGAVSVACLFWNLQHTTTGVANALHFLSGPLLVVGSSLVLREGATRRELIAIGVVFGGAATLYSPGDTPPSLLVTLVGLGGATSGCVALLALRRASQRFDPWTVVWAFSLALTLSALLLPGFSTPVAAASWVPLIGVGCAGLAGQVFLTMSFARLRAPIALSLTLSALVWAVLFEVVFEALRPSPVRVLSYLAIVSGVALLNLAQARGARTRSRAGSGL